ncbi:DUF418 domain-containing protein [Ruania suaedae]|uniref:DUF418 domain-containing protein n=1 Tax=Ruania suaedae TaxID=2897774 RepID=UPI001E375BCC|nr:DUF418 domain-containing protein [Ruania suaedae]UFU02318.1 DUF418 domain-containing protein [Ruania suaedae]
MTESIATAARGPVTGTERALAPDLARGLMLLLIALANTPWLLYGHGSAMTSAHPTEGSTVDRVVQFALIVGVDYRIYPLFAFLFGYGIVQLYRRQVEAGVTDAAARAILRRRHWWMVVFGAVHAALLWFGDIVGAYGLVGLLIVAIFFRRLDRTLLIWAAVLTSLLALVTALGLLSLPHIPADPAFEKSGFADPAALSGEENYLTSVLLRLATWPVIALGQGIFGLVVPVMMLLAFWAARRQILEHPRRHGRLLRRTAAIGVSVGVLGGIPNALTHVGVIELGAHQSWIFMLTQTLTGLFGGLGYVALLTLLAERLRASASTSAPLVAIRAVGKRSLSSYLGQSVIFAPLLSAWGLGLGAELNSAGVAAVAIAGWAALAALAYLWERRGWRGPAESLLRRLAYRRGRDHRSAG